MNAEEYGMCVWQAGDSVPAGIYLRVDDNSFRVVNLEQEGRLPASYDGHIAWYCRAPFASLIHAQADGSYAIARV